LGAGVGRDPPSLPVLRIPREEILALDVAQRTESPVVDDRALDPREPGEQHRVAPVGTRQGEFLKQLFAVA
jgi:hypothetical protein